MEDLPCEPSAQEADSDTVESIFILHSIPIVCWQRLLKSSDIDEVENLLRTFTARVDSDI